jgi:hypothetical protein
LTFTSWAVAVLTIPVANSAAAAVAIAALTNLRLTFIPTLLLSKGSSNGSGHSASLASMRPDFPLPALTACRIKPARGTNAGTWLRFVTPWCRVHQHLRPGPGLGCMPARTAQERIAARPADADRS